MTLIDQHALDRVNQDLCRLAEDSGYERVKLAGPTQFVALFRFMFTTAIIRGNIAQIMETYTDRWCFHTMAQAETAFDLWDGINGEPEGWHRHLPSGRRRDDGDPKAGSLMVDGMPVVELD